MFERILRRFRERIRAGQFVVTLHAVEELEDEGFSAVDVEHAILTGKIVRRQRDEDTAEWKYLVSGTSLSHDDVVVVVKLSPTDKLVLLPSMEKRTNRVNRLVCDICGKSGAHVRYVTRSYGKGARLLVIENVPVISCPHCGESYMTAATLHEIERIRRQRTHYATKRPVAVAIFA